MLAGTLVSLSGLPERHWRYGPPYTPPPSCQSGLILILHRNPCFLYVFCFAPYALRSGRRPPTIS